MEVVVLEMVVEVVVAGETVVLVELMMVVEEVLIEMTMILMA